MADWFDVSCRLKQRCLLSILLFHMYINDLSSKLEGLGKEVRYGDERLSCVLYVDCILIMAENECALQKYWTLCMNGAACGR